MALTMLDKKAVSEDRSEWPAELKAEFERESRQNNGCVGSQLLSETDKVRIWIIRLAPGERIGFHRHVLNYFWTSVNGGRGRQHLMDGTTVEHSYYPGETRHETYGPGEYKVHDLENLGDEEMIFNTIEFLDSANKPLPVPDRVRLTAREPDTIVSATKRAPHRVLRHVHRHAVVSDPFGALRASARCRACAASK